MGVLQDDIRSSSEWIIKAFAADGYKLDYTIDSLIQVDVFFKDNMKDGKPKPGGRLPVPGFGPILFSIGAYVGETLLKSVPGAVWITDDTADDGEMTASIKFPNGEECWPIQRVMKRFSEGPDDSIYPYGHMITKAYTGAEFNGLFWTLTAEQPEKKNPWWKFWAN